MRALLAISLALWWADLTGAAEVPKHPKELQPLVDRVPLATRSERPTELERNLFQAFQLQTESLRDRIKSYVASNLR